MSSFLGAYTPSSSPMRLLDQLDLKPAYFSSLPHSQRLNQLFERIVKSIEDIQGPTFLLPDLLKVFEWVEKNQLLQEFIHMESFEFWLIHYSQRSELEQAKIRGKITGKYISRDAFQVFFPIGMQKRYPGSHFVSAHLSPDLDTTVASFIGWLDAFSARVGEGLHLWSLPGGTSDAYTINLFETFFGKGCIRFLARTSLQLTLSALDLLEKQNVEKVQVTQSLTQVDSSLHEKAILVVDSEGHFLGDWHSIDAEKVRPLLIIFNSILRQFESQFYLLLMRFFAEPTPTREGLAKLEKTIFDAKIESSPILEDLNEEEKKFLNAFLEVIFDLKKGIRASFDEFVQTLKPPSFHKFRNFLRHLREHLSFDSQGVLIEKRPQIFQAIEELIALLNESLREVRHYTEQLSSALMIKNKVFTTPTIALDPKSEVEEIRTKFHSKDFLPVILPNGSFPYPLGVVRSQTLSRFPLGTVSLRDFSNPEEMRMASYLTVISVIDHHKSTLQTTTPSLILIGDAQSCNTLVAEQLCVLNDLYRNSKEYFIHREREISEYFVCLHAILDDTDLISKASARDIECIAQLLNRLKNLITEQKALCIDLSDLSKDSSFVTKARERILKNPDMHSIYAKIVEMREKRLKEALSSSNREELDFLLADTKEQNGCCRIGQIKLFSSIFPLFQKQSDLIRKQWLARAQYIYESHPDIDLHLQMISTIPSAKDLFEGNISSYPHQDELWIWIPDSRGAFEHLAFFLNGLQASPKMKEKAIEFEIYGNEKTADFQNALEEMVKRNFLPVSIQKQKDVATYMILKIKAGSLNSRKSMVSPYLPKR